MVNGRQRRRFRNRNRGGGFGGVPEGVFSLREAEFGKPMIIKLIKGSGLFQERLLEMGLTENTELQAVKRAPLGNPMEIIVRGTHLSIRNEDAAKIFVEYKNN